MERLFNYLVENFKNEDDLKAALSEFFDKVIKQYREERKDDWILTENELPKLDKCVIGCMEIGGVQLELYYDGAYWRAITISGSIASFTPTYWRYKK